MKKIIVDPTTFSGKKFANRYNLDPHADFFVCEEPGGVFLNYPDAVGDTPVIETTDAPPAKPTTEISKIEDGTATAADLSVYLKWLMDRESLPR